MQLCQGYSLSPKGEISRKRSREATGYVDEFPARPDIPWSTPRLAFLHPLVQPALQAAPKMPVKWDPSKKDAPRAVGASSTPCFPTADSKSKPENPRGPWSNAKGKGLDRKAQAGITSCTSTICASGARDLGERSESAILLQGENPRWHYSQYASPPISWFPQWGGRGSGRIDIRHPRALHSLSGVSFATSSHAALSPDLHFGRELRLESSQPFNKLVSISFQVWMAVSPSAPFAVYIAYPPDNAFPAAIPSCRITSATFPVASFHRPLAFLCLSLSPLLSHRSPRCNHLRSSRTIISVANTSFLVVLVSLALRHM